jgi:hypothetical protein
LSCRAGRWFSFSIISSVPFLIAGTGKGVLFISRRHRIAKYGRRTNVGVYDADAGHGGGGASIVGLFG